MKNEIVLMEESIRIVRSMEPTLKISLAYVESMMPLSAEKVLAFTHQEKVEWDSITGRFSKIQDYIAVKIFTGFLKLVGEQPDQLSFVDKLNLLEKLGVVESSYEWRKWRTLRNHLSHEYPDRPDLTAEFLNQTFYAIPRLMDCFQRVVDRLEQIKVTQSVANDE